MTWNINSVRLRLPLLLQILKTHGPDVICLQETKCTDDLFPAQALAEAGYPHQAIWGQKSYNGVAILSRLPVGDVTRYARTGLMDARHISAMIDGLRIENVYVPAGGDIPDPALNPKFDHKLRFVEDMRTHHAAPPTRTVICGDLNIAPHPHDVWSHAQLLNVVSHTEPEVTRLLDWQLTGGFVDIARHVVPMDQKCYTWWSYRNRDWKISNRGRRLDHIWASQDIANAVTDFQIFKDWRDAVQPSDHVPVMASLAIP